MLLIVKPSENTGFGAEIFADVQIKQLGPIRSYCWHIELEEQSSGTNLAT